MVQCVKRHTQYLQHFRPCSSYFYEDLRMHGPLSLSFYTSFDSLSANTTSLEMYTLDAHFNINIVISPELFESIKQMFKHEREGAKPQPTANSTEKWTNKNLILTPKPMLWNRIQTLRYSVFISKTFWPSALTFASAQVQKHSAKWKHLKIWRSKGLTKEIDNPRKTHIRTFQLFN